MVEADLKKFKNNMQIELAPNSFLTTNEGKGAWTEALAALQKLRDDKTTAPVHTWSDALAYACVDHCNDTGPKGLAGEEGGNWLHPVLHEIFHRGFF